MSTAVQLTSPRTNENRRTALRRSLRLKAVLADCDVEIVIHDISATGMLIQTAHELAPGETLTLDLPERGLTAASVAWSSGSFYGCEFELSLPSAAVSAAVLRSEPLERTPAIASGADLSALQRLVAEAAAEDPVVADDRYSLRTRGLVILGLSACSWAALGWLVALS
jgi:hypothetical protein